MELPSLHAKLAQIQKDLKVEKSQFNKFGGYAYRSKEDILEGVKPLAHERGCTVVLDDEVLALPNGWVYVVATAKLCDGETGEAVEAKGAAREQESRKGMDASQITGTASSYAGKRALGNLFAIDDTKDADAPMPEHQPQGAFVGKCRSCGTRYEFPAGTALEAMRQVQCCPSPNWEVERC